MSKILIHLALLMAVVEVAVVDEKEEEGRNERMGIRGRNGKIMRDKKA